MPVKRDRVPSHDLELSARIVEFREQVLEVVGKVDLAVARRRLLV
ncbi:MAG: hypothetical protein AMXMBFR64_41980 [Myxococcales bacterium]